MEAQTQGQFPGHASERFTNQGLHACSSESCLREAEFGPLAGFLACLVRFGVSVLRRFFDLISLDHFIRNVGSAGAPKDWASLPRSRPERPRTVSFSHTVRRRPSACL